MKPTDNSLVYLDMLLGIVGKDPDAAAESAVTLWGEDAKKELLAAAESWHAPYKATAYAACAKIETFNR